MFADKKQEIEQIINYVKKIVYSSDIKWKVSTNTFSVTISDGIDRTFTKAELESYEQQIKYFIKLQKSLEDEEKTIKLFEDNIESFEMYLKMLKNIKNKYEMCKKEFFSVHDPVFEGDQYLINQKGIVLYPEVHNNNNDLLDHYNFMPKDYHSFGKCILNEGDQHIFTDELFVIFNRLGYITIYFDLVDEFIRNELYKSASINPIKIGKKFVEFLSKKKDSSSADTKAYDLQEEIKTNESLKKLSNFISQFSNERTLLFARVPKPAHTLHLIQPAYALWGLQNGTKEYFCPIENILFCEEDHNFQDSLNKLSNSNSNNLYFIVHPENLRSDEMQYLKTFVSTRRSQNLKPKDNQNKDKQPSKKKDRSTNVPRIMIITALHTSFFNLEMNNAVQFKDSAEFRNENISEFATFNAQWRRDVCKIHNDIFLFSSEQPGQGKTYHINNIIEKSKNKFTPKHDADEELNENDKISVSHVYFDITTDEIPESIKGQTFVHFSISPEIFLNNFQIIDQLYILVQYGFFIFKSGTHLSYYKSTDIITTFLIEIPKLKDKNSLIDYFDFPIAPSDNKKEWDEDGASKNNNIYDIITEEFKGIGNEKKFINGYFYIDKNANPIPVDDNVKNLANLLFKNIEINSYTDLIIKSESLFFNGKQIKDSSYINDNRIISKFQIMINDYSKQIVDKYGDNVKMKRILFLLAIRTALYIWHFTPPDSHSIILLIPKRLMTRKPFNKDNGWIFACFYSKRDEGHIWEEDKINEIDFRDDKNLIERAKEELSKEHEYIHILTDSEKKDDISLQTQFLETLLLLLPAINFEENSLNPFNIASILLMLFSNLDHYPQDSFPKIIDDLSNNEISIEDCKRKFEEKEYNHPMNWTKMDELLAYYLRNTKSRRKPSDIYKLISQLKSELSGYESICNVINISFSKTYFGRFIEIILKIYYRHFSILQGDTGCGKTSVVRLLNDIISLAKSDTSTKAEINWYFLMIDFHGSYNQDDFDNEIKKIRKDLNMDSKETETNSQNEKVIVFLDEVNTSPAYYYVIDHIQNSTSEYFSYIAAINAYEKVNPITRDLSRVGIQQKINRQLSKIKLFTHPPDDTKKLSEDYDANKYAYNVKKPHESVKSAVILTDPQQFDEENPQYVTYLKYETEKENKEEKEPKLIVCFSDEERNAIRSIITKILLQWENVTKIQLVLTETIDLLSQLISEIFTTVRSFMKLRAIFSYRDVFRCATMFTNIFDYFHKKNLEPKLPNKSKDSTDKFWAKITSISIVISVYVSLISRFSHEKIKVNKSILERLEGHKFKDIIGENPTTICVYEIVLKYISDENKWESKKLPYIKYWDQITILFAYAKCAKYIAKEKTIIYPLPSLMLHLLILSLTVSASFHDIRTNDNEKKSFSNSDFFTCLIIGMPGTSKSKAVEIYKKYHLKKDSAKNNYFITTYLCSRTSDSDSLLAQFMNGAYFLNNNTSNDQNMKSKKAIVILEEVGLANYNPSKPLKILHHLCDKGVQIKKNNKLEYSKIIPIQLSNYAIDFANMNRGFLVCAGLPTDEEFATSIALGKFISEWNIDYFEDLNFSSNLLYQITEFNDTPDGDSIAIINYESSLNLLINNILQEYEKEDAENLQTDFNEKKEFYHDVLIKLWKVTQDNGERPSFYPMRPLFNLIEKITELKYDEVKAKKKEKICQILTFLLNSFTHDKDKVKKIYNQENDSNSSLLNDYLKSLEIKEYNQKKEINSVTLYHSFRDGSLGRKALLIRTENYEAYRLFDLLTRNADAETLDENTHIFNFVPFQFQDVGTDCQRKFDKLFEILCEYEEKGDRIFCSIGNDPFSDYIIDILNSINHSKQCPTAILKGFPVYLPQFPDNIKFIFFINEGDIYNHELKNPVPYPLIDRLDHLFLNKKILSKCSEYLLKDSPYDILKAKYLLDLPLDKEDKKKDKKKDKKPPPEPSKEDYLYNYTKSDFLYLKEAILANNTKEGEKILNDHFEHSFIKSLDDLISRMKKVPSEYPFSTAIVFTKTPIYEQFEFNEAKEEETKDSKKSKDSKEFEDKEFAIVDNIRIDPISEIENAEERKSLIIHSDIFNLPDENTLNNALFIANALEKRIIYNSINNDDKKFLYIIVFHINKNKIPDEFGFTTAFPVVWIESLPDTTQEITQEEQPENKTKSKGSKKSSNKEEQHSGVPLIQDICNAIYSEKLPTNSPLLNRVYEKVTSDYCATITDKDKQKNITSLRSQNGIKLSNCKGYKIENISKVIKSRADELEEAKAGGADVDANENANANEKGKGNEKNGPFIKIEREIIDIVNKIVDNNNNNEIDEQKRINTDLELNEELDNLDIEVRFFSTVSEYVDDKSKMSLSIVVKYIASIKANSTKIEAVDNFARFTYDNVFNFSKIIPNLSLDTFSSAKPNKEINISHPELLFYNVLRPFFNIDGYYNSLNKMKVYIKLLPPLNGMKLVEMFRYINDNYFDFKPEIPFNDVPDATRVTIDMFDDFFNSRGLYPKDKKTKDIVEFMKIYPGSAARNLYTMEIAVSNIKNNIHNDQWNDVQYKKILLADISKSFMSTCDANDNPHPCIIYSHFINVNGFTFQDYNGNDPDKKIYKNATIPWIVDFFLYGSFNKCTHPGKDSNYLNNFVDFVDLALEVDANSATMLSTTKELPHFLYDLLFSEMCKNKPTEKVESFTYIDHLSDIPLLKQLVEKHPNFADVAKNDSLTKEVNKTEIEILADDYNPFSDDNKTKIIDKYNEIKEIEDAIKTYNSWKESHLEELGNNNIFDNARSHLFEESKKLDDMFVRWFLNPDVPLLVRQVYEICKAVKSGDNARMTSEFNILCRLINPWNDEDKVTKYFWKWFIESGLSKSPFNNLKKLMNTLNDSSLKPILMNCSPYYVYENFIISKKTDIKTFFIERLLYTTTILQIPNDKTDYPIICQIFNFMSSLPFVKQTKNLYIIAGFINEVMRVYRDQINLLYLIFNSLQKCTDLLNIEQFRALIDDPNRTESRESLNEALQAADDYNKGEKAVDKLINYINRLIEVNNNTILTPSSKQSPNTIHYRLVAKINVHTNLSLMNTFLPALAHMELKEGAELYRILPSAFKILTGHKDAKNFVNSEKFYGDVPSIFDFSDGNAMQIFVKINSIDEKSDIFGLPKDDLPKSLCNELGQYLVTLGESKSYRKDIWNKVRDAAESTDYSSILDTLIPLFEEEPDDDDEKKVIDVESLKGVGAAAHFLKSNKIGDRSLFVKIDTNS